LKAEKSGPKMGRLAAMLEPDNYRFAEMVGVILVPPSTQ
jgi:hypothetical protein